MEIPGNNARDLSCVALHLVKRGNSHLFHNPQFRDVFLHRIGGTQAMEKVLAAVRTGPGRMEFRDFPMPDVPEDSALLKMEVAGICGTDVRMYTKPPSTS